MRIYKKVMSVSSEQLQVKVQKLTEDGWKPGRPIVEIDTLYPHRCHMYKDLTNKPKTKNEVKNA